MSKFLVVTELNKKEETVFFESNDYIEALVSMWIHVVHAHEMGYIVETNDTRGGFDISFDGDTEWVGIVDLFNNVMLGEN